MSLSYDDPFVQEVLCNVSILDMAKHIHNVEPVSVNGGTLWTIGCQFHDEKTPSLRFWHHGTDEPDSFYCFGCNRSGNIISYVMYSRAISPEDAFKYVCDVFGYEHPESESSSALRKRIKRAIKDKRKEKTNTSDVIFDASILIREIVSSIKEKFGSSSVEYENICMWADKQIKNMNIIMDSDQKNNVASNLFRQYRSIWFKKRNEVMNI